MIAFVRGIMVDVSADTATVDVGGIGYEVMIHQRALRSLPARGQEVFLYTRMITGENEFRLYGFQDRDELEVFKILNGVSGLGPRTALAILGLLSPDQFYRAVAAGDLKALTQVPGVGKKTAERVLFEMKDKIPQTVPVSSGDRHLETGELLEALVALGFSRSEVYPEIVALIERNEFGTLEENLKKILKTRTGPRGLAK